MTPPFIGSIFAITLLMWQGILSPDMLSNEAFITEFEEEFSDAVSATILPVITPTTAPSPEPESTSTPTPQPSPKDSPSPVPEDCDFEYHYDSEQDGPLEDGEVSINHNCREELNNGSSTNNLNVQIDTGNNSTDSSKVKIDVKVDNR